MFYQFRKIENLHIFLWLIKDFCWISDYKIAGLIMILPTIFVALYITWKLRKSPSELAHNSAVTMWIFANSIWMIGEFFYDDTTRPFAKVFFVLGLLCIVYYYIYRAVTMSKK